MPLWDPQQQEMKLKAERRRVRHEMREARRGARVLERCEDCGHFEGNHHPEQGCFVPECRCAG